MLLSEKEILKVYIHDMQSAGVVLKHNKQLTHSSNNTSDFLTLPPRACVTVRFHCKLQ